MEEKQKSVQIFIPKGIMSVLIQLEDFSQRKIRLKKYIQMFKLAKKQ